MIKSIGRYQIQGEIGKGGFGKVYRAWDPTVNRQVAIKILTVQGDDDLLTRFRNEAAAAGNLHHKNIVTVHDFGEHNGTPYMVMQLLEGENLQDIITRGRALTLLDKMNIMLEVAEGLHCAHQHGIVHRDVKPANIMILPDDSVQIMDFGIARVTASASRQTRTGFVIGTVLYMSPEQFLPNMEVDYRADIWAYGVIYYELLTGRHPFAAPEQTAILYQIAHVDPTPVNNVAPDCPSALADIVQRALMKDREFRYQSLRELQFDVQPILLDLKRERASELMTSARELVDSGEIDQANMAIQRILELDPSNRDAHGLMSTVKQHLHRRNVQPRIDGLVKRAEELIWERNYRQAAESIEAALKLSQTDSSLRARLDQIRKLQEQALKAERLIAEAKQQFESQNLTGAFRSASEALEADPDNSRANQIISMVNTEMERRDSRRRLDEGLNRAKTLVLLQTYDEAIALLSELVAVNPGEPAIVELLSSAQREKDQQERRQRRWREMTTARDLVRDRNFESAIGKLEALQADFPDDPEVGQLLLFAREELAGHRRAEAIERAGREVQYLVERDDFDAALRIVEQSLRDYQGDPTLLRLLQSTNVAKGAFQRRMAVDDCLRSCEQLRREGRVEDALRRVNATMLESSEEPRLTELRALLQREYDAYRRAEALRRDLESIQRYLSEGNPDQAIALIERLRPVYPEEAKLGEFLSKARHAKEQQEQQIFVQKQLERISALEQAQDWKGALSVAQEALARQVAPALAAAVGRLQHRAADEERAARVATQAAAIRDVISGRNFGRMEELLRAARKEFPGESIFRSLTEQAVATKRSSEVDGAMGKIRDAWRSGQLASCRTQLAAALATYPTEQRLVALEQEIASQVYAEAIRAAQEELKRGRLDAANAAVLRALEWRPQDPAATELLNSLGRERQLDAAVERIRHALDSAQFDEGRDLIAAAAKTYSGESRIAKLEEDLRSRACSAALAAARTHLERGEHDLAESAARRALHFRPQDPTAATILSKAEAERQITTAVNRVEQSRREGDAARSRELIAVALKKYPAEPRLTSLAEQIQTDAFSQALNAARRDLEAGRIAEAETAVNNALQLRPGDAAATSLLSSIRSEKDIADVIGSAKQAWRSGELERCRNILESGIQRHPRQDRLRNLDSEFRAKVVADFVSAARNHLAQQRFEAAKESAATALTYKPGDEEISGLVQSIARDQAIEDAITRTVSARRAGQFDKCLDILKSALAANPSSKRLIALDREIREQVYGESIGLAREQLTRQRFDQAIKAAETALIFRPNDPTAATLIQAIRLEQEIEAVVEKAQAARRSGQLERALELLGKAQRSSTSEARLQQLTQEITQEIVRKHVEAGRDHLTRERFDDAEKAARGALKYNSGDASAAALLESVRTARVEVEKRKALDAEQRDQARRRDAEEQARQRAEEEQARKRAAEEQARQRTEEQARQRAEEEQARKRAAEEQNRAQAAAASSTAILKTGSLTPIENATAAPAAVIPPAQRQKPQIKKPEPEARKPVPIRPKPEPPPPAPAKSKTPLLIGAGAALVIVVLAVPIILNRTTPPPESKKGATTTQPNTQSAEPQNTTPAPVPVEPKPTEPVPVTPPAVSAELQVQQSRLVFAWQRGTPPPALQSLAISGSKQRFLATGSARWIAVTPNRASAPRTLAVSINPRDLPLGPQIGIIKIASPDNSFSAHNVVVEITVTPEAKPELPKVEPPKAEPPKAEPPKQEAPKPEVTKPEVPKQVALSPAAQGQWFGSKKGRITYSGDLPAGGRVVISTSSVVSGGGELDVQNTPPPFDAVRVDRVTQGISTATSGYNLVLTNTTGAPIRSVVIEWSYQPKR